MAGFGGAVKLTGESEYRKALQLITQNLKEVSSQMKVTSSMYDSNDKSTAALAAKTKDLNDMLKQQNERLATLKAQYSKMSSEYATQEKNHTALVNSYTKEKNKLEEIEKTQGKTSQAYKDQSAKVTELSQQVTKSSQAMDSNAKSMSNMRTQINNAQADVNNTTKAIEKLGDETEDAGKEAKDAANDGFTVFKGVLADLSARAISSAINGLKQLGGALVNVGKQAINSYAQYEQLVGGVETLFKDSAPIVQKYADVAYKTAGMSANQYMETVTGFSASLLQSLGGDTAKAAEVANRAVIDMSDNANKMGTAIGSIQYAYQGFAKQNYTMLDNLKLGYGGTKTEMQRLIKDAAKLTDVQKELGVTVDASSMDFANCVNAISVMQKQIGITGTTSKEAADTIEGSAGSMKAAWENLLTDLAKGNADLGKSVDILVSSVITQAKNLVPKIKNIVSGFKTLINGIIKDVFPKLKKEIPELKPLIEVFEWFIKHKTLVVGALQTMVAAFAVNKILSFTKGLSDTVKSLIAVATQTAAATAATTANTAAEAANTAGKVAGTTATGALTVATNLLNAAWEANPIGIVITGLTLLVGAIGAVIKSTGDLTDEEKAYQEEMQARRDEIDQSITAWDSLKEAQQRNIDVAMTEQANYSSLFDELGRIVDQNGKVKKGYEERASFITSTLSDALGIEIKTVDGVIQNYNSLKDTIDKVMEKKKAQIILDSQESLYAEAIKGQDKVLQNFMKTQDDYKKARQELDTLEAQASRAIKNRNFEEARALSNKVTARRKDVADLEKDLTAQEDLYQEYAYNIANYNKNLELAHKEQYDKMSTATWDYVKEYQGAGEAEKKILEDKIEVTRLKLSVLEKLNEDSTDKIYQNQVNAANKELEDLNKQYEKYKGLTEEGLAGVEKIEKNAAQRKQQQLAVNLSEFNKLTRKGLKETTVLWSDSLDDQLSVITGKKIEFKEAGNNTVQMFVDGEKVGAPKAKGEMAKIATESIKEITNKNSDAKKAGENLIDGINNGIKNPSKQSGVLSSIASFGTKLLNKLKASLQERSPSKATQEMGNYLLEGLGIGLSQSETGILKQVAGIGQDVISAFSGELSQGVKIGSVGINAATLPNTNSLRSTGINKTESLVDAFKEALSQMNVVMDNEQMGKFVETTVTRAIYA